MKTTRLLCVCAALPAAGFLTGCESTGDSGGSYESGYYYPGYYGVDDDGVRPRPGDPPRPAHPIATPPAARPMPMPRPSMRR